MTKGFSFNDVSEGMNFKPTIPPGIQESVKIESFGFEPGEGEGKPHYTVKIVNEANTMELNQRFYVDDTIAEGRKQSSLDTSLSKLKHICKAVLSEADQQKLTADSKIKMLETMISAAAGKSFRMKFVGEEYITKDRKVGIATRIGFPPFAESHSIVPYATGLKFVIDNSYDMKRLPLSIVEQLNDTKAESSPVMGEL